MSLTKTLLPPDVQVPSLGNFSTVFELLLDKSKNFSKAGKEYYAIDALTREKRFFSKFDDETKRIASAFHKLGLKKGDMVIFMPTEVIKLHIFLAGVWRANGFCRSSYPEDDPSTLAYRIKEGDCKFILCDHNGIATCKEALKGVPWPVEIITIEKHADFKSLQQFLDEDDGSACPPSLIGKDDIALILCTSGTTGASKGAVHTHAQLIYEISMLGLFPFTEPKPNLLFSKGTHISGSTFGLALLATGKTGIITGKITNELILKTAHELKPGFAFAFPTFLLVLVGPEAKNYDFSSIETIWTGGTIITPAIKKALLKLPNVKDFVNAYGLTESMICTTSVAFSGEHKTLRDLPDFSVGKPYPSTYIQVRDIETLQVLGPNQEGEVCCRNPGVFKEYYKNPKATKEAFVDGFLRTGDIGYYDEQGFLYIKDRLKEIFKYYNNHISPSELEGIIGKHPNVNEVCVVGVPDPEGGGDVPRAFITLKGDRSHGIEESIRKFSDDQVPNYKHLRGGVHIISELPKGKTGKVTRNLVAKLEPEVKSA